MGYYFYMVETYQQKWRRENPGYHAARHRARMEADPEYRDRINESRRKAEAKRRADPVRWAAYLEKRRAQPSKSCFRDRGDLRQRMLDSARKRARDKGLECNLTKEDIVVPTHCPVLGIELKVARGAANASPNSPSLDRIDNSLGYVRGNIIVMSFRANTLKNNATADELQKVATWVAENEF